MDGQIYKYMMDGQVGKQRGQRDRKMDEWMDNYIDDGWIETQEDR